MILSVQFCSELHIYREAVGAGVRYGEEVQGLGEHGGVVTTLGIAGAMLHQVAEIAGNEAQAHLRQGRALQPAGGEGVAHGELLELDVGGVVHELLGISALALVESFTPGTTIQ